jgi:hypothetical protein
MTRALRSGLLVLAFSMQAARASAYFEYVVAGARGEALGPAASSLIQDATAYHWNPASLTALRQGEVLLDYAKPYDVPDLNDNAIGFAMPWRGTGLAVAWHRLAIGSGYAEDQFCLAAGRRVWESQGHALEGGLTYKLERISVPEYWDPDMSHTMSFSQSKGSLDVGLRWRTPWRTDLSWVTRDVVQPRFQFVESSGGGLQTPRTDVGGAVHWNPESTILFGWSQYPAGGSSLNVGMEILFYDVFAIRSGLTNLSRIYEAYGSPAAIQYSGGFGIFHHGYFVDAAVTTHHDLGASYHVSVRLPVGARRRP